MSTSPLGLYYIGGVVVHSDGGPQAALEWFQRNEGPGADIFMVGGIQPDSSVIFAGGPPVYFNAKTRKLQNKNTTKGKIVALTKYLEDDGTVVYCAAYAFPEDPEESYFDNLCYHSEIDALLSVFELLQSHREEPLSSEGYR